LSTKIAEGLITGLMPIFALLTPAPYPVIPQ
jgi:hypothetical protein